MNPADPPEIALEAREILNDGSRRIGYLVFCDGALAAVLIEVTEEDTGAIPGWYLEAGFGPCSSLRVVDPPIFPTLEDVAPWVVAQIEQAMN
ncbi:hypothetical protein SAMN02983003_2983 [Devosia enhydra]|uniref:Uncharacterized protein n=1 Tax=Devosia enhydra TaxID=665118 RepID=A0A1K2I0T4_9HYPH|nr:hypothetical protein [Devosia enhydra]SFZ85811.1 hypothetical protein SAMN02983003_2983 [Devosia enhydra]